MFNKRAAWLRRRGYRHFDDVTAGADATSMQFDAAAVAKHAFFPFIGKTQRSRRYRRDERKTRSKPRPLRYAAHKDARIYARYAGILSDLYEREVERLGLGDSILAYRKLPGGDSNIESAKGAFDQISRSVACDVITADVSDFFGSLDHSQLKSRWTDLLNVERLPPDHFAVFKQLTQYRWVELDQLIKMLGVKKASLSKQSIPGRRGDRFGDFGQIRRILKEPGLVRKHDASHGIPQGSPTSAVLSNLYMIEFDQQLDRFARSVGGLYRRYSDDILLVVPSGLMSLAERQIDRSLSAVALTSNPDKFSRHQFREAAVGGSEVDVPLEYLGFEFDGRRVLLKKKSLARYHQRTARLVGRMQSAAGSRGETRLNRRKLIERCTHLGRRNFITYARRASKVFYPDLEGQSPIDRQLRRHTRLLRSRIDQAEQQLADSKENVAKPG